MMNFRAAAIQMTSSKEVDKNLQKAAELIEAAALEGANIVVLPEMFSLIGATEAEKIEVGESLGQGKIQDFLANHAVKQGIWLVGGTLPLLCAQQPKLFAASFVYNPKGEQVACYNKLHLFDAAVEGEKETYQESKMTAPGNAIVIVDTPFVKFGIAVCYDIRFPVWSRNVENYDLLIYIANFPTRRIHAWKTLLLARAIENQCFTIGVNRVGTDPMADYNGESCLVNCEGNLIFSESDKEIVATFSLDLEAQQGFRQKLPFLKDQDTFLLE